MIIDYEHKAKVLKSGLPRKVSTIDRRRYLKESQGILEDVNFDIDFEEMMLQLDGGYTKEDIHEARKINTASYKRSKRLQSRIASYLEKGRCVFATLTFRDDVLNNTSVETRRVYVARFLKSISLYYVANIDYGKETEREHYHALILTNYIKPGSWSYGFDTYLKVRCDNLSSIKVAKYISKLTNHAIKETTKRCCYIYSRIR